MSGKSGNRPNELDDGLPGAHKCSCNLTFRRPNLWHSDVMCMCKWKNSWFWENFTFLRPIGQSFVLTTWFLWLGSLHFDNIKYETTLKFESVWNIRDVYFLLYFRILYVMKKNYYYVLCFFGNFFFTHCLLLMIYDLCCMVYDFFWL